MDIRDARGLKLQSLREGINKLLAKGLTATAKAALSADTGQGFSSGERGTIRSFLQGYAITGVKQQGRVWTLQL